MKIGHKRKRGRKRVPAKMLTIPAERGDGAKVLALIQAMDEHDALAAQEALEQLAEMIAAKFGVEPTRATLHGALLRLETPIPAEIKKLSRGSASAHFKQAAQFARAGGRVVRHAPRPGL